MHGVPEWCAAVTTTDLYTAEHGAGLHRVFKPLGCADCRHAQWAVQQRVDRLLGTLPPLFANCRLATFPTADDANQRRVVELARSWLDDASPSWLFLWGPTGRGKTGLAVGVLHELA